MFFKKKPDRSSLELTVIKQKIAEFTVDNHKIDDWIQDCQLAGTTLTLKMRIPEHIDVERVHAVLGEYLYQHGVQTLDMEVVLVKTSGNDKNSHDKSNHDKNSGVQSFNPNHHATASPNQTSIQDKSKAQDTLAPHPRIRHIIAVASGKGGVGKSTVSVNLALALQSLGHKVGLLDADIYGPSLPDMLGVAGQKPMVENDEFVPIDAYGLPMISIGSLIDSDSTPVAWRGIKATGALMQLYNQTAFPHLDYLIIDMPPGTGDIQLSLAQRIPITASIVVTTPQHIALLDAKKGVELFKKTHIPILGVVENMSVHICSACGHSETIFGECGGDELAESADAPLLARLPLAKGIREQMDKGVPSMIANDGKGDEYAPFYRQLAKQVDERIGQFAKVRDENRIF